MTQNWQGTNFSQDEFFDQQESIPVEISPPEPDLVPFEDYAATPLHPTLKRNILAAGYKRPTSVQKWGVPLCLAGKDVMACAQTGSGKTAFYLLPAIDYLLQTGHAGAAQSPAAPCVLIMGPTRELCVQIFEEAEKFAKGGNVRVACCYGGTEYRESTKQLTGGVDIIVATPGRLQDLCERKHCSLGAVQSLILDEADRMLDMGFEPSIRLIVQKMGMNKTRQTVMTSATFPEDVQHLAQDFMKSYSFMAVGRVGGACSTTRQKLEWVEDEDKNDFLYGLLLEPVGLTLVFVNTKVQATETEKFLKGNGFTVESIHGDRSQPEREAALQAFKSGEVTTLIATDVAARGLDIPNVALVIQFDLATGVDDYVHRIGRTGRIGNKGLAVGMVNNRAKGLAGDLLKIVQESGNVAPSFLVGMAISNGTYHQGGTEATGKYGGQDVRKGVRGGFASAEERAKAKRFGDFNKNAYGQGDENEARAAASTVGPKAKGSYFGAAAKGNKGKGKGDKKKGPY